ncbi:MAG: pilin [Patescibacteria group bacterium]|nr:pilin [Patescibacteria group bacterium]
MLISSKFFRASILIIASFFVFFFPATQKANASTNYPPCQSDKGPVISVALPDSNPKIAQSFNITVAFDTANHPDLYKDTFHINFGGTWFGNNGGDIAILPPGESTIVFNIQAPSKPGPNEFDLQYPAIFPLNIYATTCSLGTITVDNANLAYVNPLFDMTTNGNSGQCFKATVQAGSTQQTILGNKNCATVSPNFWQPPAGNKCSAKEPIIKPPGVNDITITDIKQLNNCNDLNSVNQSVLPKILASNPSINGINSAPPWTFTVGDNQSSPVISFSWVPQTAIGPVVIMGNPSIDSGSIDSNQQIQITVTFSPIIAHKYQVTLNKQRGSLFESNQITVTCPVGQDCFAVKNPGSSLELTSDKLEKDGDNYKLNFIIPSNYLEPGSNNPLAVTVPSLNQTFAKKSISISGSSQCKLDLQITKGNNSFANAAKTNSSSIDISLVNGANNATNFSPGNYEVYMNDQTSGSYPCSTINNCGATYSLSNAKIPNVENSATYTLVFRNQSNNSICGSTTITVGGDPTLGGSKGGAGNNGAGGYQGCVNGQDANGNACTSAGGETCNPSTGQKVASGTGVLTAIGCVPTDPVELVKGVSKFIAGAGGGVALLLMIFGAVEMITSGGSPEGVKAGRERFTSAAIGLLFIILSVTLLQIIGVDILNLPGFGK